MIKEAGCHCCENPSGGFLLQGQYKSASGSKNGWNVLNVTPSGSGQTIKKITWVEGSDTQDPTFTTTYSGESPSPQSKYSVKTTTYNAASFETGWSGAVIYTQTIDPDTGQLTNEDTGAISKDNIDITLQDIARGTTGGVEIDSTTVLSEPYTDEKLKGKVEDALQDAPYIDVLGTASYYKSETSLSISRGRYRIAHGPIPTCYLKVTLKKTFYPEDADSEPTVTTLAAYVWIGTGSPCLPDPSAGVNEESNVIYSPWEADDEPAENGYSTISNQSYSFLPDYAPPSDGSADGFPNPYDDGYAYP